MYIKGHTKNVQIYAVGEKSVMPSKRWFHSVLVGCRGIAERAPGRCCQLAESSAAELKSDQLKLCAPEQIFQLIRETYAETQHRAETISKKFENSLCFCLIYFLNK
jgi:hypothetical protein